uniref:Secreted protein n=1 Tax=Strongyloides venezuelensis TaxID=75913 RepID=A0A0K0G5N3_STRVS
MLRVRLWRGCGCVIFFSVRICGRFGNINSSVIYFLFDNGIGYTRDLTIVASGDCSNIFLSRVMLDLLKFSSGASMIDRIGHSL